MATKPKNVSAKRYDILKRKLTASYTRNGKLKEKNDNLRAKEEQLHSEIYHLQSALERAIANDTSGGWAAIAERQRIYIKSLEERMAGTWDPSVTHQEGWRN